MRTIKFRTKKTTNDVWVYGSLVYSNDLDAAIYFQKGNGSVKSMDWVYVNTETVCQFTGLLDKNGKEIYEGDIVEYYELCTYCINPDCEPHLIGYGDRLYKMTKIVEFKECSFGVDDKYFFARLSDCGISEEEMEELKEKEEIDSYFDTNGYEVNYSIIGIEVIGNIYDNPELINK